MSFFANIFKSPIQKEKKRRASSTFGFGDRSISTNNKQQGKAIVDTKSSTFQKQKMEKNSTVTTSTSSTQGREFKLNEDGRTYHGTPDVKYVLPNDDDGITHVFREKVMLCN